ncbi:hypothetical protein ACXO2A_05205 [Lactobacillus delbrueckii subsp. bulgaricus]
MNQEKGIYYYTTYGNPGSSRR